VFSIRQLVPYGLTENLQHGAHKGLRNLLRRLHACYRSIKRANLIGLALYLILNYEAVLSPSSQRAKRRMTTFSPIEAMFW
jgi:hypothetical protein